MEELGERFAAETDQVVTGLTGLRRRTDGIPEPPTEEPGEHESSSSGPSKRASLHDSPLTDLFQRTRLSRRGVCANLARVGVRGPIKRRRGLRG